MMMKCVLWYALLSVDFQYWRCMSERGRDLDE